MEYLQLKHSVEKLTDCLKIMPKEDKNILQDLINKYNKQLKSINYLDENNEFFDQKELRHINQFLSNLKAKVIKPYTDKVYQIEDEIGEECGYNEAEKKFYEISNKISRIAQLFCKRNFYSYNFSYILKKEKSIEEKSKVYKDAKRLLELKNEEFWKLSENSEVLKQAEKDKEVMQSLLDKFDIDLKLKNMIAYRARNMECKAITSTAGNTIREIISTEIEKQWLKFLNKNI